MKFNKLKSKLNSKQKAISSANGTPGIREGNNGDLTVRNIQGKGLFLFYKYYGKWYSTRLNKIHPKYAEDKQSVIIPKGRKPRKIGELTLDTSGNLKTKKDKNTNNQLITMYPSDHGVVPLRNTLDVNEIELSRTSVSGMGTDAGGTSDLRILNTTGHSFIQIETQGASYDPYLLLAYRVVGESEALKQWCIGMDNSDTDLLHFNYKSSGTDPLTPSSTTASQQKMTLDTSGNLGILGQLTITDIPTDSAGDNYLVEVSNVVKKRTPAETLADIGAQATVTAGTNCTFAGTTLNVDDAFIKNDANDAMAGTLSITSTTADQLKVLYDASNYGLLNVSATGDLEIETVGAGTTDSDITLNADGSIILDSANGKFMAKKASTEFSVSGSSYAGMILGYRMIGEDAAHDSYTVTTSYVVPDSAMTVRFIAPPSGSVEVQIQIQVDTASGRFIYFGLSDNATYNSIGNSYEQFSAQVDETDSYVHQHCWTITGLTAGDTYNYWLGSKSSGGIGNTLRWGGSGADRHCDFIMKVTALPAAVSDFAEYD